MNMVLQDPNLLILKELMLSATMTKQGKIQMFLFQFLLQFLLLFNKSIIMNGTTLNNSNSNSNSR